jgi:hypothetical protein
MKSNSSVPNYSCQTIELLNPIPTLFSIMSSASLDPSVLLFLFLFISQEGKNSSLLFSYIYVWKLSANILCCVETNCVCSNLLE